MSSIRSQSQQCTITLLGDLMLGRLIDQLLPTHVNEPEEAALVESFRHKHPHLQNYSHKSPWGNVIDLFQKSDLVLGNLETSATTHDVKWPQKTFNYRMHPRNVQCLKEAGINYVSLANNHTLDFSREGLLETIRSLDEAGIVYAGTSKTASDIALPAELRLTPRENDAIAGVEHQRIHVYSFADHPSEWSKVKEFNFLEYSSDYKQRLCDMLATARPTPTMKIISVHWGPNYRWQPDGEIRDMAHHIIDYCGADVIWGHSSHHIQGVEIYHEKLIIYGCGDFIDDYAVNHEYRNDLGAVWNLKLESDGDLLQMRKLEIWPTRIRQFQVNLLDKRDGDHGWVTNKFKDLCAGLGTRVDEELGPDGQIVINMAQ